MLGTIRKISDRPATETTSNYADDNEAADRPPFLSRIRRFFAPIENWRVAEALLKLRAQIDFLAPNRSTASDGTIGDASHQTRDSDHNPWVLDDDGVGVVTAMDITDDPGNGCSAEVIAESLRASEDSRIKYVIWNRQIFSSAIVAWEWRPYSGRNPHTTHVHISVMPNGDLDSVNEWDVSVG